MRYIQRRSIKKRNEEKLILQIGNSFDYELQELSKYRIIVKPRLLYKFEDAEIATSDDGLTINQILNYLKQFEMEYYKEEHLDKLNEFIYNSLLTRGEIDTISFRLQKVM